MKKFLCGALLCALNFQSFAITINRAVIASDANPNYIQFWPICAFAWDKIIGCKPTLILVAPQQVTVDESLGDVIRFEPLSGIPTSFQAQVIRLLAPALFPDDVCIISDMDMIPLKRDYFTNLVQAIPDDQFIIFRNECYPLTMHRYPMCYNAAKGSTFQEIFGVSTFDEIRNKIKEWHRLGWGWITDERVLYDAIQNWEKYDTHVFKVGHGLEPEHMIDRRKWKVDKERLLNDYYIHMHCPRPYNQYKSVIDAIVSTVFSVTKRRNEVNS